MQCLLCPRTAWYHVQGAGYCDRHKAEAIAAARKESRAIVARLEADTHAHDADGMHRSRAITPWQGYQTSK